MYLHSGAGIIAGIDIQKWKSVQGLLELSSFSKNKTLPPRIQTTNIRVHCLVYQSRLWRPNLRIQVQSTKLTYCDEHFKIIIVEIKLKVTIGSLSKKKSCRTLFLKKNAQSNPFGILLKV